MGVILTKYGEAAYNHEGFVGRLLTDGSVTSSWVAENAQVTDRLVARCSCGWISDRQWVTDASSPAEVPSSWLRSEILAVWETEHAVPLLERTVKATRGRVAARLRDLAAMVEAGYPSESLYGRLDMVRNDLRGLQTSKKMRRQELNIRTR